MCCGVAIEVCSTIWENGRLMVPSITIGWERREKREEEEELAIYTGRVHYYTCVDQNTLVFFGNFDKTDTVIAILALETFSFPPICKMSNGI